MNEITKMHLELGWIDQAELEFINEFKKDIVNSILSGKRNVPETLKKYIINAAAETD